MSTQKVKIYAVGSKSLVECDLADEISATDLANYDSSWKPKLIVGKTEDAHWKWQDKVNYTQNLLGYPKFSLRRDDETLGLMMLNLFQYRSRENSEKQIVYLDYLSVEPLSRPALYDPPRFKGIGSILFQMAILVSIEEGMDGRIGLHSLPAAEGFYRDKLKLKDYGKDPSYSGLRYFELSEADAQAMVAQMNL